jgi:hypothetical protein
MYRARQKLTETRDEEEGDRLGLGKRKYIQKEKTKREKSSATTELELMENNSLLLTQEERK